jgi:hypothetical protein
MGPDDQDLRCSGKATPSAGAEEPIHVTALRKLAAEIACADYRDPLGHRLVRNTAFLEAVALLQLRDQLERRE